MSETMGVVAQGQEKALKLINDLQDISVLKIIMIFMFTWLMIYFVRKTFPLLAEKVPSQFRLYVLGAVPIIRLCLLVTAIFWSIPIVFNINVQNFLVIAGAVSVAIGFAFKDYVSSLIAGVVAIIERPYRPGDWVKISGDYGEVKSIGMRAIKMVTPGDDVVVVPHDKIWQENITNSNDGSETLMCVAHFYLHPDHDVSDIKSMLNDVALTSVYLAFYKPVNVMVTQTIAATHYQLKAYPFDMRDQFRFIGDLTLRGKRAIQKVGVREVCAPLVS